MTTITRPQQDTYPAYMETYIKLVNGEKIYDELFQSYMDTMDLVTSLDAETLQFRYAPGKWTVIEILQHIMDTERIFCFRALCFARQDKTNFPGFDENDYVITSLAMVRNIDDMIREFSLLRASTIELFKSFTPAMLEYSGTANNNTVSVKALLFAILGHELHHRSIITQRYMV